MGSPVPGTGKARLGCSKELRCVIAKIEAAGGTVEKRGKSGHLRVYVDGAFVGGLAGTPSDHRTWKNDLARLRRHGLNI